MILFIVAIKIVDIYILCLVLSALKFERLVLNGTQSRDRKRRSGLSDAAIYVLLDVDDLSNSTICRVTMFHIGLKLRMMLTPNCRTTTSWLKFNQSGETILNKMQLEIMDQVINPNFRQSSPVMRMGEGSLQSQPRLKDKLLQIIEISTFRRYTDYMPVKIWTCGT